MDESEKKYDSIVMVERALQIIKLLSVREESCGVSEIADSLGLPKANVFRILNTMSKSGFAIKNPDTEKYDLSIAFIEIGEKLKCRLDLERISAQTMEELSRRVGETVNLGILFEDEVLTIHTVQGESSILVSKLKATSPLYCSSTGKLFLSEMEEKDVRTYFQSARLLKRTINTITDFDGYLAEKEQILRDGIAYDREEYEYGLTCMSSPVYGKQGKIAATMGISGPTSRLQYKDFDILAKAIKEAAEKLSDLVGRANL